MDPFLAFTTYLEIDPDFDQADFDRALQAHHQQQRFIQDFLDGKIPADVVLDCLGQNEIDVDTYVKQVGLNLGLLNQNGQWRELG